MDRDSLVEAAPHYLAIALLILVAIGITRAVFGDLGFWIEAVIVIVIAVAYQSATRYLGRAPSMWEKR